MSQVIKLKKGLDILLQGEAKRELTRLPLVHAYALKPEDFPGVTPKLLVRVDDAVKVGTPLFFDKYRPQILFTSPVSGKVSDIVRGEKRKILEVVITPEAEQVYETFEVPTVEAADREQIKSLLLQAGLWPMIMQRPYGIIANPQDTPKSIFVSGFDSAPLAPDMNFVLENEAENLEAGFALLGKLTDGKVYLGLRNGTSGVLNRVKNAEIRLFEGPHPAGNVGVQIHHIDPINKGDVVWTVDVQHVAMIGRFFRNGKVDMSKIIALTGSETVQPRYFSVIAGLPINSIVRQKELRSQTEKVRIISGNVLTGRRVEPEGYLGFYSNQVTVIPEGDTYEFLGWGMPRLNKFSVSRSYFSWLCPKKHYRLDTNMNGGVRAYVVTGLYDKYLPMDIYPLYLLKAILAGDIDKMENLGIYEVIEEDFALCEFVDPSKTEMQAIIRQGIDLMIKELN
ncbi:MAG TPA: Na(+)-translocating NADH-quinone reductase subunit A [Candidatus Alistipes merdigallinarum]|nr:Na(+)-translocating NADH-quinone reductase subunit A [Candidatus Alistipes merdigallinarum]